jgi:HNH endonuclease
MSSLINEELRRLVAYRADHLCEYCLIHESDGLLDFQVDHIISRKHGGATESQNLAYACPFCNRQKGSDLGTILPSSGKLIRFFHPRNDTWSVHFKLREATIEPLTEIAEGTIRILGFNHPDRLLERQLLISIGRYPSISALARLRI